MKYRVSKQFAGNDELITTFNGKTVALVKDLEVKTPDSQSGPGKTRVIKMATQEELKKMYNEGNPVIEEYDEQADKSLSTVK